MYLTDKRLTIDLKVTLLCNGAEYSAKPLYPMPKGDGVYGL